MRVGPGAYTTQFTMERTIGDLGQEIRQPSNPFANLAQCALRRSQVNALKNIHPELDSAATPHLPKFARDLGEGYVLLRPRDKSPVQIPEPVAEILPDFMDMVKIRRWGRLHLPNGQIVRSLWGEQQRRANGQKVRVSCNVKVCYAIVISIVCFADAPKATFRRQNRICRSAILFPPFHS